jgi:sugar lactone lactonase YvrE
MFTPKQDRIRRSITGLVPLLSVAALLVAVLTANSAVAASSPTVVVAPPALFDLAGTSVALDASVAGAEPGSFQVSWSRNLTPVSGASSQLLVIPSLSGASSAGSYTATITGSSGTATSAAAAVSIGSGYSFITLAGVGGGSVNAPGAAARFEGPSAVAVDASGNIYVADTVNDTVRKISTGGAVTTLAGSAGLAGNANGTGPTARFNAPSGIAVDSFGNVYVADTGNNTIRKVTPSGAVTVLAGTAGTTGNSNGNGSSAKFNTPTGLAIDGSGKIYVADTGNNALRQVTASGSVTTLVGSTGIAGSTDGMALLASFSSPQGVAVDNAGIVYVADTGNNTLRVYTPSTGAVSTLAGTAGVSGSVDGTGPSASFDAPTGVATNNTGDIFVSDAANNTIREVSLAGAVTTLAGAPGNPGSKDGTGAGAQFNGPLGLAEGLGGVYVADSANDTVRLVSPSGGVTTIAGTGSSGYANGSGSAARFISPVGLCVDNSANVYVADTSQNAIRMITPSGNVTTLAGGASAGSADGVGTAATFNSPSAIAVDASGNVYVADSGNNTIRMVAPGGVTTTLSGTAGMAGSSDGKEASATFNAPLGITVDHSGNIYVADTGNGTIRMISSTGSVSTIAGTPGMSGYLDEQGPAAQFDDLEGITIDPYGTLYVVEGTGTVRSISPTGMVSTVAGTFLGLGDMDGAPTYAQLYLPQGIAADSQGNLFVSNTGHDTIREITPTGTVTTVAGAAGIVGGSDGAGAAALFYFPGQIAVDLSGNLYVADTANHSIRVGTPPAGLPAITSEPAGLSVKAGASASFTASASGTPSPTFQWYLGGAAVPGATSATFTLASAQASNAGLYSVIATNSVGSASSFAVALNVAAGTAPLVSSSPSGETVAPGASAAFTVSATGTSPLAYQWNFNGNPISGAVSSSYTIASAQAANAGLYSVTVTNAAGSVTTPGATLTVASVATSARLLNLSARAAVGTSQNVLIAGFYVSGSGQKSLLVRGIGPTLANFKVTGYLEEPTVALYNSSQALVASNTGWQGSPSLIADFTAAGAFQLLPNSSDSALELSLPSSQPYTAEVSGADGGSGIALAEVYDADPNAVSSPTRLTNLSARADVGSGGGILIAGFVIGGVGTETVLIRAVGPSLSAFGLTGLLANPVITLYDSKGNMISSDRGWQNPVSQPTGVWAGIVSPADATHSIFSAASAFDLPSGSADSAILITLPVGSYSAQVTGTGGSTGVAVAEVYEVPQ